MRERERDKLTRGKFATLSDSCVVGSGEIGRIRASSDRIIERLDLEYKGFPFRFGNNRVRSIQYGNINISYDSAKNFSDPFSSHEMIPLIIIRWASDDIAELQDAAAFNVLMLYRFVDRSFYFIDRLNGKEDPCNSAMIERRAVLRNKNNNMFV